jgi:hypothetical protein
MNPIGWSAVRTRGTRHPTQEKWCGREDLNFHTLGEMRDPSFENQRHRASGLNLVTAAIVLWNTAYLERAIRAIKDHGDTRDENLLQHLFAPGLVCIST